MTVRLKYGQLAPEGLEKMKALEHYLNTGTGLEPNLMDLVRLLVSLLNGCEYCIKLHTSELQRLNETPERIAAVAEWLSSAPHAAIRAPTPPQLGSYRSAMYAVS